MTRTGKSPRLSVHAPEPAVELHPEDAVAAGLRDGELASIESRWGAAVMRVRVSPAQRPGEIFAPMHWTAQFASAGRINAAVNSPVDPVSGQPELKHTPARVVPWQARWHGFLLSRRRLGPTTAHWVAAVGEQHWRYELADSTTLDYAVRSLGALVEDGLPEGAELLQMADRAAGTFRAAWIAGDRLAACLFLGATPSLPARAWLASLFAQDVTAEDRMALLAGRAADAPLDASPIVCACFNVSQARIARAIADGACSTREIGAALQAGTNCGSCLPELRKLIAAQAPAPQKELA